MILFTLKLHKELIMKQLDLKYGYKQINKLMLFVVLLDQEEP
jgi:hypothetical protein